MGVRIRQVDIVTLKTLAEVRFKCRQTVFHPTIFPDANRVIHERRNPCPRRQLTHVRRISDGKPRSKIGTQGLKHKLFRMYSNLLRQRECKVCLSNLATVLFLPCGHLSVCPACAPRLQGVSTLYFTTYPKICCTLLMIPLFRAVMFAGRQSKASTTFTPPDKCIRSFS